MTAASEEMPVRPAPETEAPKPKSARKPVFRNADLFRLRDGLVAAGKLRGVKFAKALSKNLRVVRPECEDMENGKAPDAAYLAYVKQREELALKHSKKDDAGQPVTRLDPDGRQMVILASEASFAMAHLKLLDEHKDAISGHDARLVEYAELLKEEAEHVELYMIPFDLVPKEINGEEYDAIREIIDD